jgi:signal transduction histidine kinase
MRSLAGSNIFKTVLVVDDDGNVLKLIDQFLSSKGLHVITASGVKECMERFKENPPDLLLVDYLLPDGTGLDTVRMAMKQAPDLAVIVMTGVAVQDVHVAAEAIKLGAIEYLTKPFNLETLEALVLGALEAQEQKKRQFCERRTHEVFTTHLITVLEKERHKLTMELHDDIGQSLTSLKVDVELMLAKEDLDGALTAQFKALRQRLTDTMESVRRISYGLRPRNLDAGGLKPALESLVSDLSERSGIQINCFFQGLENRCHIDLELAIYRIVQEALTNMLRHSGARNAFLNVIRKDDALSATVEDDGMGFDPESVQNAADGTCGMGLWGMQQRAAQFNGEVWIDSRTGRGTCVSVEIPLKCGRED